MLPGLHRRPTVWTLKPSLRRQARCCPEQTRTNVLSSPQGDTGRRSEPGEPPALPSVQAQVPLHLGLRGLSMRNAPAHPTLQVRSVGERAGRAIRGVPAAQAGTASLPTESLGGGGWAAGLALGRGTNRRGHARRRAK